ncbi:M23 family metallopeptidase [Ornithinibacillus gellani]|uniref:M23 family metallopeptidase n=1 Tax=Ornithinibacillus gellani TaxID=2293253 RepID=UPI000F46C9BB|nr:M23 family metallopeptidase [Ornithinibacillus gellani]TQS76319.1 M23 family metallopeptidase [Ornithinibacillus gellani]
MSGEYNRKEGLNGQLRRQKKPSGTFIALILLAICVLFSVSSTAWATGKLQTVYHVYADDTYIGKVDDQAVVEQFMEDKLEAAAQEEPSVHPVFAEEISFVPEKMFEPSFNNDETIAALAGNLTIAADAVELRIGGTSVGFFPDEETVLAVLTDYVTAFVDEKDFAGIEVVDGAEDAVWQDVQLTLNKGKKKLAVGYSAIRDVQFSETVQIGKQKMDPASLLTEKQGVKLLKKGTLAEKVHLVQSGEVLSEIAAAYDLSTKKLLQLNPDVRKNDVLKIDQEIQVEKREALLDVLVTKEEKQEKNVAFETEVIDSKDMYKGDEKLEQKGKKGKKEVVYSISLKNGKEVSKKKTAEKVIKKPVDKIIVKGTKVVPSRGTGKLSWPTSGGYVSSQMGQRWGRMHKGIDIARPSNRAITAADNGVVTSAGYQGGFGNKIVINHNNGMQTIYAHLSAIQVKPGQVVEKGTKIGVMGSTGNSTGVHLHFEVHVNGALKNPLSYLNR